MSSAEFSGVTKLGVRTAAKLFSQRGNVAITLITIARDLPGGKTWRQVDLICQANRVEGFCMSRLRQVASALTFFPGKRGSTDEDQWK
ncbi:hypothetical protein ACO22_07956 [Paracoccidioides brasiliensis]|uniref:Uncharacterized protein n=1 Tax=Paracoccidioides brasiliensis TaxID=121759 RepID=A0A1D2J371_PARBR|nr:hypothetical protein ACO22_07956 [Paracoccidioides brasiliensis]